MINQLHQNDLKQIATQLDLPVERFAYLLQSANHAHEFIKKMGPFYGREDVNEPTFRITAEPVRLPLGSKKLLDILGNDLLHLGKALPKLPIHYLSMIGEGLDLRVPITWRIDSIINTENELKVNEIEGIDSVSALMMIEQLAYGLQPLKETTMMRLIESLKKIYLVTDSRPPLRLAIIRNDLVNNPFTPNARRFIELIKELSKGQIECDLFDIDQLRNKQVLPEWDIYSAVLNEAYCSPTELNNLGISMSQILTSGNYNALVNKGVFALLFEYSLQDFWKNEIGEERYIRLKNLLIPTRFITTIDELNKARSDGKVVKVTWADGNMIIVNRAKGVAIPTGDIDMSSDERWNLLRDYMEQGYTLIAQDYVEPTLIPAYLRKKGTNLEPVAWYNRVCVKYVVDGMRDGDVIPIVYVTAAEVTLGPEVVPAGRKCTFTAGELV